MVTPESHRSDHDVLSDPLELPCGAVLRNRLVKAAMSDSLGDGQGGPTAEQVALYQRWTAGGAALSLIGEVQIDSRFPETPGNLVLHPDADLERFKMLAQAGSTEGAHIWPQLGHAGALSYEPISRRRGPSALDLPGLVCGAMSEAEIAELPQAYAAAAAQAKSAGFSGVQIHAGHGFLLSQFLSPLFNRRTDHYGGSIEARSQLLVEIIERVRSEVGERTAIAVKINSSDQLDGGLTEADSLVAIERACDSGVDLVDISGGTYFPGAPASSDRRTAGPYFVDFARRAKAVTTAPIMVTGGFKTRTEAAGAIAGGAADVIGLARPMVLDPELAKRWLIAPGGDPVFPLFESPPPGGITAWYTMRLTAIAEGRDLSWDMSLEDAVTTYERRDLERVTPWQQHFV